MVTEMGGAAVIAAIFLPWPVVLKFEYFRNDFGAMIKAIFDHAVESIVLSISMFPAIIAGIAEDWSYPFKFVWQLIVIHNGNQFELAHYYPTIMIVIMMASLVGGLFRLLGNQVPT